MQLAVARGAQWMTQSVLGAGLSVLSITAGPVLGAFLTGVLTTRVGAPAMLTGMLTGVAVVAAAWWTQACAWTWYAALGASVTAGTALVVGGRVSFPQKWRNRGQVRPG